MPKTPTRTLIASTIRALLGVPAARWHWFPDAEPGAAADGGGM
jgi:hypothetical protein